MGHVVCLLFLALTLSVTCDAEDTESPGFEKAFIEIFLSEVRKSKVLREVYSANLSPKGASKAYSKAIIALGAEAGDNWKSSAQDAAKFIEKIIIKCYDCKKFEDWATIHAKETVWGLEHYTPLGRIGDPVTLGWEYADLVYQITKKEMPKDEATKIFCQVAAFFQFLRNKLAVTPGNTVAYGKFFKTQCMPQKC